MKSLHFLLQYAKPKKRVRQKTPRVQTVETPRVPPVIKQLDHSIPKEKLVEVGVMGFKNPETGEYDRTKPIYQMATPELLEAKKKHEEAMVDEISQIMLELVDIKEAKNGYSAI